MTGRDGARQVGTSGEKATAPFAGTSSLNDWEAEPSRRFASILGTKPQSHTPKPSNLPMLPAAIRSRPRLPAKDGTALQMPNSRVSECWVVSQEVIAENALAVCSWMRRVGAWDSSDVGRTLLCLGAIESCPEISAMTAPLCTMLGDSTQLPAAYRLRSKTEKRLSR